MRKTIFKMKRLMKSRKAVSPVIAVILLIAIAVAASVTVFAYTQGIIGGISRADLQITQPTILAENKLLVRIQNTGGTSTSIDEIDFYESTGTSNHRGASTCWDATTGAVLDTDIDDDTAANILLGPGESVSLEIQFGSSVWQPGDYCNVYVNVEGTSGTHEYQVLFTL